MVLFADSSVRFVKGTVNARTFEAFATMAGGELVQEGEKVKP